MHKKRNVVRNYIQRFQLWSLNKRFDKGAWVGGIIVAALTAGLVMHIANVRAAGNAVLSVSTSPSAVQVGNNLVIKVHLNTAGEAINAVQANFTYPTAKFDTASVSCDGGGNLPNAAQTVASGGNIKVACYINPGTSAVTGSFDFATITLHASTAGSAAVNFVVSADDESAVVRASDTVNVLGTPVNGSYTVYDPDSTPPTGSVTAPAGSAVVGGTSVAVSASASDTSGSGVASVQFLRDADNAGAGGVNIGSVVLAQPYTATWNTTSPLAADGAHTVRALITDLAGNTFVTPAISVTVDNTAPTTSINSGPTQGSSTTSTSASLTFSSSDGTATFQCQVDSGSYGTCTSPKSLTNLSIGSHTFNVRGTDTVGNVGPAATTNWTVTDGQAPTTAPTGLAANAPLSTQVNLTWNADALDNVGVTGYKIYRDGSLHATVGAVTSFADTTSVVANTAYAYTISALDAAGNEGPQSSPAVNVTTPATGSDTIAPSIPQNVRISALHATSMTINWDASTDTGGSGLKEYRIFRNGSGTALATITAGTNSYVDASVTNNVSYTYVVRAYDNALNVSVDSTGATMTARDMPGDIDSNGRVNGLDLGIILSVYGQLASVNPAANIVVANDGFPERINGLDLGLLLTDYGQPR